MVDQYILFFQLFTVSMKYIKKCFLLVALHTLNPKCKKLFCVYSPMTDLNFRVAHLFWRTFSRELFKRHNCDLKLAVYTL